MSNTLAQMQHDVYENARAHGWWEDDDRNIGEMLALIHSEISEALEEWRHGHAVDEIYYDGDKPEGFLVELADAVIRIMDLAEHFGASMEDVVLLKHEYNKTRPYRHGGLKI